MMREKKWLLVGFLTLLFSAMVISLASNNAPWHQLQKITTTIGGNTSVDEGNDGKVDLANRTMAPETFVPPDFDQDFDIPVDWSGSAGSMVTINQQWFNQLHNSPGNAFVINHDLGGDASKYKVDMVCKITPNAPSTFGCHPDLGCTYFASMPDFPNIHSARGMRWVGLDSSIIKVYHAEHFYFIPQFVGGAQVPNFKECSRIRLRIWKNQ